MRGWVAKLVAVVAVLVAVGFIGLAGIGGRLYWNRVERQGEESAIAKLAPTDAKLRPGLAEEQIAKVFGYDYQTIERSFNDVYPLLTPEYRKEFQDRATKDIIPQARERELVSQANVVGAGVLAAQRNSASVMVYLNRTVTDKSRKPVYDGSRLKVDYLKVDGKWLINYITPI
jgi:Mce-associated membrane protein